MRELIILMISCGILALGVCRPQESEENGNSELADAEYESEDSDPNDDNAVSENEAPRRNQQIKLNSYSQDVEAVDTDQEEEESRADSVQALDEPSALSSASDDEPTANHFNKKFSENRQKEKSEPRDDKPSDTAMEAVDEPDNKQREYSEPGETQSKYTQFSKREFNNNPKHDTNGRTHESENEKNAGHLLFDNVQDVPEIADKHGYAADSYEQHHYKKHHNTIQAESKNAESGKRRKFRRFHLNRDRRNSNEGPMYSNNKNTIAPSVEEVENMDPKQEEETIKKHVKRLSSEELQELISSLSEDKRELLKKIMSSDSEDRDSLSKREITKKAGSLQENSNIDCGLLDLSKIQDSSTTDKNADAPNAPSSSSIKAHETSETNTNVLATTTSPEDSKGAFTASNIDSVPQVSELKDNIPGNSPNSDSSLKNNQASNLQNTNTKTESKREAVLEDVSNSDTESIENYFRKKGSKNFDMHGDFSSQDESLSQLIQDEPSAREDKMPKREASEKATDYSELIRSLEESFPNPDLYDESNQPSAYAPHIRVKRTHTRPVSHTVKRRQAAVLPEAKVAYFPFRAGNDDEDDEGNEFDDDGFYDRNSNLARNVDDGSPSDAEAAARPSRSRKVSESQNDDLSEVTQNENIESDTSLGSDTDGVLSGIEGVDDNSMFSNSVRNRRGFENNHNTRRAKKRKRNRSVRSAEEERKTVTENYINAPNIPLESEVFGALHKNYDASVGRHKRVRRVKRPQGLVVSSGT